MKEAGKLLGGMNRLFRSRSLGMNVKKLLYAGLAVPTALYSVKSWRIGMMDKERMDVMEMRCLKSLYGVTRMDRVRNEERRTSVVTDLL